MFSNIAPLISIIFSTIYVYNSSEFIELLVSQPLKRKSIWLSLFSGLSVSLGLAFFVGASIPILLYQPTATGFMMLATGCLLSVIFVAIALFAVVITRDKAKEIGVSILLWLYFALLFDGLVLFLLFQFEDYPLEKFVVGISAFNPIDLSRILILLQMDIRTHGLYRRCVQRFFWNASWYVNSHVCIVVVDCYTNMVIARKFNLKDL